MKILATKELIKVVLRVALVSNMGTRQEHIRMMSL